MKAKSFAELYDEAERHEDYHVAGAILEFNEEIVRQMERKAMTRAELARRLGSTQPRLTKLLRGQGSLTLAAMVRLARALGCELRIQLVGKRSREARPISKRPLTVKTTV